MLSKSQSIIAVIHQDSSSRTMCVLSTWVLVNGLWNRVETEAPPLQQAQRFDQWVDRACFLYHVSKASSFLEVGVCSSSSPLPALANVPWIPDAVLQFSLESISSDPAFASKRLQPLNNCQPATLRVLNTLLRLVLMGGVGGRTAH